MIFAANGSNETGFRRDPFLEIHQYNGTGQVGEWLGGLKIARVGGNWEGEWLCGGVEWVGTCG